MLIALQWSLNLTAQNTNYFLYDIACQKKYLYQNVQNTKEKLIEYHLPADNNTTIVLQVTDTEHISNDANSEKKEIVKCGGKQKNIITTAWINNINKKQEKAYIIEDLGTEYAYYNVERIILQKSTKDIFTYKSSDLLFDVDLTAEALQNNNELKLEKKLFEGLPSYKIMGYGHEISFVHQIGVIRKNIEDKNFELVSVDGHRLQEYIKVIAPKPLVSIQFTTNAENTAPQNDSPESVFLARGVKKTDVNKKEMSLDQEAETGEMPYDDGSMVLSISKENQYGHLPIPDVSRKDTGGDAIMSKPLKKEEKKSPIEVIIPENKDNMELDMDSDNGKMAKNKTYTVQSGDNLYRIALKYQTTVEQLKKDNNLPSDTVTINQVLIIR